MVSSFTEYLLAIAALPFAIYNTLYYPANGYFATLFSCAKILLAIALTFCYY